MIVLALFIIIFWGIPLWGIIDAAVTPDDQWARAGQNKILWVVLQLVIGIIGAAVYFISIRPKVRAAATF